MPKPIILSGMQPTGSLHLGNYLGALKNWVSLQNSGNYEMYIFIADLHSLTIHMKPEERRAQTRLLAAEYIAAGIDPKKSTIFVQSAVPEHTQLAWIFNTVTPVTELYRMTQFKDKSTRDDKNINTGLLTYPILQAADILLYHGQLVPVGQDQVQHLELTRDIARWFNNRYGEYFPIIKPLLADVPKVMSLLDPLKKMSKSAGSDHCIGLADEPTIIEKKLKRAVTATVGGGQGPGAEHLLTLLRQFAPPELYQRYRQAETTGAIRYGELKQTLAAFIANYFTPFRKRRAELLAHSQTLDTILARGRNRAKKIAEKTMLAVKNLVGIS